MATEVIMPKVDMVQEEGTFVEWLKQEGEEVAKGEPLFVILTDKASIEVEAPASGVLKGTRVAADDVVPVTEVIAYIVEPGEDAPEHKAAPARDLESKEEVSSVERAAISEREPVLPKAKVAATPVARRLAQELGVDLGRITGSGPQGRVQKADVIDFQEQREKDKEAPTPPAAPLGLEVPLPRAEVREIVELSGPRRIIADRMSFSAFTAPHISLSTRVDMSEVVRLRDRLQDRVERETGHRLSFTAVLARAVSAALLGHPALNASLDGDQIIMWEDVHLGIATSVENYLIVPVLRQAQKKDLMSIVSELGDLVSRARNKRLAPSEMKGSTFTISNLGMFGVESFTAIINPPEAGILAVGRILDTAVGREGEIALLPMMELTLSVDHRIVDGAAAGRFLAGLKETLENPYLLV